MPLLDQSHSPGISELMAENPFSHSPGTNQYSTSNFQGSAHSLKPKHSRSWGSGWHTESQRAQQDAASTCWRAGISQKSCFPSPGMNPESNIHWRGFRRAAGPGIATFLLKKGLTSDGELIQIPKMCFVYQL